MIYICAYEIKDKYNLTGEKNECGFYKINDNLKIVVDMVIHLILKFL